MTLDLPRLRPISIGTIAALVIVLQTLTPEVSSAVDARMFRYPDVSATRIAFVYAGDIWVVDKRGRRRQPAQLASGRGVVSALLAGR